MLLLECFDWDFIGATRYYNKHPRFSCLSALVSLRDPLQ